MENKSSEVKRPMPRWLVVLIFVALVGFLAIIGAGLANSARKVQVGDALPEFSVVNYDKSEFHSADAAGKVVVINFWASWCLPCEDEAAELEAAWRLYQPSGDVIFLGVGYSDTEPKALDYLRRFDITYPNTPDFGGRVSQIFRIRGVPETYIYDRQGKLASIKIGPFSSLEEIQAAIDPLLK